MKSVFFEPLEARADARPTLCAQGRSATARAMSRAASLVAGSLAAEARATATVRPMACAASTRSKWTETGTSKIRDGARVGSASATCRRSAASMVRRPAGVRCVSSQEFASAAMSERRCVRARLRSVASERRDSSLPRAKRSALRSKACCSAGPPDFVGPAEFRQASQQPDCSRS